MKKSHADTSILPIPDAVPTLKRAVRKSRRAPVALRPMDPAISGLEAALHDALEALIREETFFTSSEISTPLRSPPTSQMTDSKELSEAAAA
jgi:hypothetical protein